MRGNSVRAVVIYAVGLVWALSGIGKLVSLVSPEVQEPSSWVSEFSPSLVVGVSLVEILAAVMIFAGRSYWGLLTGLGLLLCFAAAL